MCSCGGSGWHQSRINDARLHGAQLNASSSFEHHFRETVEHAQSCAADQAHVRSNSGHYASLVLCGSLRSETAHFPYHRVGTVELPVAEEFWTSEVSTERHVPDLEDFVHGLCPRNGPCPVCAEKRGRHSEDQHQAA